VLQEIEIYMMMFDANCKFDNKLNEQHPNNIMVAAFVTIYYCFIMDINE
jgi:hypothetical protein